MSQGLREKLLKSQYAHNLYARDYRRRTPSVNTSLKTSDQSITNAAITQIHENYPISLKSETQQPQTQQQRTVHTRVAICALCRKIVADKDKLVMSCCRERIHDSCHEAWLRARNLGRAALPCQTCTDRCSMKKRRLERVEEEERKEQEEDAEEAKRFITAISRER